MMCDKEVILGPRISTERREKLVQAVKDHFALNKPYLKPDYSLQELSDDLGICYQYVSFVINHCMGTTFKDLLNSYRVAYVMQLMEEEDAGLYTLQWLSRRAGFGSRTTFFRAFQRVTGRPPSAYTSGAAREAKGKEL